MGERAEINAALARVARLVNDQNIPGLIVELESPLGRGRYDPVRGHAARALGRLGDPRAIPYLIALAEDPLDTVRMQALASLGKIGDPQCLPTLLAGLHDSAPIARMAAAEGLGWLGATEAIPDLWKALDSDEDAEVRLHVAEALAQLGDPNVASRIPGVVANISWRVRHGRMSKRLMKYAAQPSLGDTADFWS